MKTCSESESESESESVEWDYQYKLENLSQIFVSLRILLIIPVTVASAEKSFSKLMLVKNYLRSTMSQKFV
jgi:hypothetical protein